MWAHYDSIRSAADSPITTFGGDHDERTPVAALEVWDHHTGDGFTMLLLERNHSFVQDRRTR
jgi:surfactin synthase thioesterase subunit